MPTSFTTTFGLGDVIQATHVTQYAEPVNRLESAQSFFSQDAGSTDAYAVSLDPAPTTYTAGMLVHFQANTANTGGATLNVNSLGAKTLKKNSDQALETGDVAAGQIVAAIFDEDGDCFQLVSGDRAAQAAIATVAQVAQVQSIQEDRYYFAGMALGALTGTALVANTLFAAPFVVHQDTTWTRLGLRVTTGVAATNARLGIYADDGGKPGDLVLDAGTVTTTNNDEDREITISQTLAPGLYWLAIVSDGAPSINCANDAMAGFLSGRASSVDIDSVYNRSFTYASLPDPFGSGSFGSVLSGRYPGLWMRVV